MCAQAAVANVSEVGSPKRTSDSRVGHSATRAYLRQSGSGSGTDHGLNPALLLLRRSNTGKKTTNPSGASSSSKVSRGAVGPIHLPPASPARNPARFSKSCGSEGRCRFPNGYGDSHMSYFNTFSIHTVFIPYLPVACDVLYVLYIRRVHTVCCRCLIIGDESKMERASGVRPPWMSHAGHVTTSTL